MIKAGSYAFLCQLHYLLALAFFLDADKDSHPFGTKSRNTDVDNVMFGVEYGGLKLEAGQVRPMALCTAVHTYFPVTIIKTVWILAKQGEIPHPLRVGGCYSYLSKSDCCTFEKNYII
jgi:hypothetical protein